MSRVVSLLKVCEFYMSSPARELNFASLWLFLFSPFHFLLWLYDKSRDSSYPLPSCLLLLFLCFFFVHCFFQRVLLLLLLSFSSYSYIFSYIVCHSQGMRLSTTVVHTAQKTEKSECSSYVWIWNAYNNNKCCMHVGCELDDEWIYDKKERRENEAKFPLNRQHQQQSRKNEQRRRKSGGK